MRDIYIPSVTTSVGVGYTTGITLSVPTVFTVNAQSLVFSFQQLQYVRAAREQIQAARLSMEEMRQKVQEDVVVTYISLDQALEVSKVFGQQYEFANRLAAIDEDRHTFWIGKRNRGDEGSAWCSANQAGANTD